MPAWLLLNACGMGVKALGVELFVGANVGFVCRVILPLPT